MAQGDKRKREIAWLFSGVYGTETVIPNRDEKNDTIAFRGNGDTARDGPADETDVSVPVARAEQAVTFVG